ncbi:MAG TPA: hypothetical protein VKP65_19055 [Rhodothermales bacterium]|nr:hypothetical protein [Rhodothermales bacterium]
MTSPLTGSWIEWVLYVGAGLVLAIYTWQVVVPRVQHLFFKPKRDPEERAAELLRRYRERKANKLPPE